MSFYTYNSTAIIMLKIYINRKNRQFYDIDLILKQHHGSI